VCIIKILRFLRYLFVFISSRCYCPNSCTSICASSNVYNGWFAMSMTLGTRILGLPVSGIDFLFVLFLLYVDDIFPLVPSYRRNYRVLCILL
jgi:hypothetical protein